MGLIKKGLPRAACLPGGAVEEGRPLCHSLRLASAAAIACQGSGVLLTDLLSGAGWWTPAGPQGGRWRGAGRVVVSHDQVKSSEGPASVWVHTRVRVRNVRLLSPPEFSNQCI